MTASASTPDSGLRTPDYAVVIIGGGIVGLATGLAIVERTPGAKLCVIEKEREVGAHQTGNNSGVIHSGVYYKPGSAKAKTCVDGRRRMIDFCVKHGIKHELCGKVVVATREDELPRLKDLLDRALANGVPGVVEIGPERIKELEPHAAGIRGLHVPGTGIVDYAQVARKYAELITQAGGEVRTGTKALAIRSISGEVVIETTSGAVRAKQLINCGGLHCDRLAQLAGAAPGARIVPFRGEYYKLAPPAEPLVKGLIYPVPDPRFPFLGVHFTRMAQGGVEAGPNAVLALKREGYSRLSFNFFDSVETFTYPGFWRMALKYWRTGCGEMYRSVSKAAFVSALQRLLPAIRAEHLIEGGAGVRAQALLNDGSMVDDFRIVRQENMIHVLNAPSPAATASLAIGAQILEML